MRLVQFEMDGVWLWNIVHVCSVASSMKPLDKMLSSKGNSWLLLIGSRQFRVPKLDSSPVVFLNFCSNSWQSESWKRLFLFIFLFHDYEFPINFTYQRAVILVPMLYWVCCCNLLRSAYLLLKDMFDCFFSLMLLALSILHNEVSFYMGIRWIYYFWRHGLLTEICCIRLVMLWE